MTFDPRNDHPHEDQPDPSDNPEIRKLEELEERMRKALATKENPMSDSERTIDRLRRADSEVPKD